MQINALEVIGSLYVELLAKDQLIAELRTALASREEGPTSRPISEPPDEEPPNG